MFSTLFWHHVLFSKNWQIKYLWKKPNNLFGTLIFRIICSKDLTKSQVKRHFSMKIIISMQNSFYAYLSMETR